MRTQSCIVSAEPRSAYVLLSTEAVSDSSQHSTRVIRVRMAKYTWSYTAV